MTLDEWFTETGKRQTEVARTLGISDAYMSDLRRRQEKAGADLALKIEKLTDGKVTVADVRVLNRKVARPKRTATATPADAA